MQQVINEQEEHTRECLVQPRWTCGSNATPPCGSCGAHSSQPLQRDSAPGRTQRMSMQAKHPMSVPTLTPAPMQHVPSFLPIYAYAFIYACASICHMTHLLLCICLCMPMQLSYELSTPELGYDLFVLMQCYATIYFYACILCQCLSPKQSPAPRPNLPAQNLSKPMLSSPHSAPRVPFAGRATRTTCQGDSRASRPRSAPGSPRRRARAQRCGSRAAPRAPPTPPPAPPRPRPQPRPWPWPPP